ncbi:CocE/NonD family hydrolase [Streptomyces griseus]|uniref:Xaa-Pro dipeptidyl-peptidase n=1 Tax=Streptomyces stephensoniae TaxID=3375367 RepID=A0ABU2W127_9ACTN|nr:CocE/NonD family hydrolase [Streptomyces griseus]MDT0490857.1 CocE/NonD family hydrolase [Streptomyces griseus]
MRNARRIAVLGAALLAVSTTPSVVHAGTAPTGSRHDFAQAIKETVFIPTGTDSDSDGVEDRVRVQIIRPATTQRVPAIIEASPYHGGFGEAQHHPADVTGTRPELAPWTPGQAAEDIDQYPPYWDNHFVSRGYASLAVSTLGTGGSTGCPGTVSPEEIKAMTKVVEWVRDQPWSTGRSAMAGTSYKGTLALATATTGVRGLTTVVPMLPVSRWYDYYRANGGNVGPKGYPGNDADMHIKRVLTRSDPGICSGAIDRMIARQDHVTGDHNAFWAERDFADRAHRIRASVFVIAGQNDWNVRPKQSLDLFRALRANGVKSRLWLTQGQHDDPLDVRRQEWLDSVGAWFDQELKGIRNGADREPSVQIQRPDLTWSTANTWPAPGAVPRTTRLAQLSGARETGWTDDPSRTAETLVSSPESYAPGRSARLFPPVTGPTRISGTPSVTVRAKVSGPSPYLSAFLVDYGPATYPASYPTSMRTTAESWCFGDSAPGNTGCRPLKEFTTEQKDFKIITRGWMDTRNRLTPRHQTPVDPKRTYTFRFDLEPLDHIVPAGHRIGIVLATTDRDHTLRFPAGTKVALDPAASSVTLPTTTR